MKNLFRLEKITTPVLTPLHYKNSINNEFSAINIRGYYTRRTNLSNFENSTGKLSLKDISNLQNLYIDKYFVYIDDLSFKINKNLYYICLNNDLIKCNKKEYLKLYKQQIQFIDTFKQIGGYLTVPEVLGKTKNIYIDLDSDDECFYPSNQYNAKLHKLICIKKLFTSPIKVYFKINNEIMNYDLTNIITDYYTNRSFMFLPKDCTIVIHDKNNKKIQKLIIKNYKLYAEMEAPEEDLNTFLEHLPDINFTPNDLSNAKLYIDI